MPVLSARVRVHFGPEPSVGGYVIAGTPEQMLAEIDAFAGCGVTHLALAFGETEPRRVVDAVERFDREVLAQLRARPDQRGRDRLPTGVSA